MLQLTLQILVTQREPLFRMIPSMNPSRPNLIPQQLQQEGVSNHKINIVSRQELLVRIPGTLPDRQSRVLLRGNQVSLGVGDVVDEIKIGLLDAREVEEVGLLTEIELGVGVISVLDLRAPSEDDGVRAVLVREKGGDLFAV
jgi:hypothetical protein